MKHVRIILVTALALSIVCMLGACDRPSEFPDEEIRSALEADVSIQPVPYPLATESKTEAAETTDTSVEITASADEAIVQAMQQAAEAAKQATKGVTEEGNRVSYKPLETADSRPRQLNKPPNLTLRYIFNIGEHGYVHEHYLYPCSYTWTAEDENGTSIPSEQDNGRPCDYDKTHRIKLEDVADSDYIADFFLREDFTESYTLLAYPTEDLQNGTPCTIQDGKLTLFQTPHYYELTVQYTQGTVVYGFFAE